MKKIALVVAAFAVASVASAALVTGGTIGSPLVNKNSADNKLVLDVRVVGSDLTPVATPALTPTSNKITSASTTGFTWTLTPVAINLSSAAGVANSGYIFHINTYGPCAAAGFDMAFGVTSTTAIHATIPPPSYVPLSTTGGIAYGVYGVGAHILGKSLSSSSCMGTIRIEAMP
jgi:hypothetical protein